MCGGGGGGFKVLGFIGRGGGCSEMDFSNPRAFMGVDSERRRERWGDETAQSSAQLLLPKQK